MLIKILFFILLFALVFIAVRARIKLNAMRLETEFQTINSPLSEAVMQLLGLAGGIYLSLLMLVSFLSINIPETILIGNTSFNPLASLSLLLSLLQPIILDLSKIK